MKYMDALWYRIVEGISVCLVLPSVATLAPHAAVRLVAVGAIVWLAAIRLVHWRRAYDALADQAEDAGRERRRAEFRLLTDHEKERIQIVTLWESLVAAEGDRAKQAAVRDLEAVLAMPSWSPQAREGIRACISKLKTGDHTAHLAEARAKLGIVERDVKHSKSRGGVS